MGIGLADGGLELEHDPGLAGDPAARHLAHPGGVARRDAPEGALQRALGDHRLERLLQALQAVPEAGRHEVQRLAQAHVPQRTAAGARGELLQGQAGADLALERQSAVRGVLHAPHVHRAHLERHRAQEHRQRVHHVARIDAGAEQRRPVLQRQRVELGRQLRMAQPGPHQLLAGGDRAHPALEQRAQRRRAGRKVGAGRDDRGVDRLPVLDRLQALDHSQGGIDAGYELGRAPAGELGVAVDRRHEAAAPAHDEVGLDARPERAEADVDQARAHASQSLRSPCAAGNRARAGGHAEGARIAPGA